jgi:hypothetical protein
VVVSLEPEVLRRDIICGLQAMARRGQTLKEMVRYIQKELGFSEAFAVPVLAYLCQAFSISLKEVLPVREWLGCQDDQSIAPLLAHLRRWKDEDGTRD